MCLGLSYWDVSRMCLLCRLPYLPGMPFHSPAPEPHGPEGDAQDGCLELYLSEAALATRGDP